MKKFVIGFSIIFPCLLFFNVFGLTGANQKVKTKVKLVKEALEKDGYNVKWFTISEKRNKIFNALLPNSAKKSHHLKGNAIDVFVIDIDGDGTFTNKDLDIVKKYNRKVERRNPSLKGAFGTYKSKPVSKHMIHFDTRGYSLEYNH
jgi:hypothetical protein